MKTTKIIHLINSIKSALLVSSLAAFITCTGCGKPKMNVVSDAFQSTNLSDSTEAAGFESTVDENISGAATTDFNESGLPGASLSTSVKDESSESTVAVNNASASTTELIYDNSSDDIQKEDSVNLIMVGDILLHTPLEECYKQSDGSYDYTNAFANTSSKIESADLALVNQEVIIGGEELGVSGYPCFNAPYSIGDELVETGFDVICHGTNHAMDKGKKGILNCTSFWQTNYPDITVLGIYDSAESRDNIYIYEKNNIKIAVLNYTYGTNGIELPSDMPYAVNLLKESQVRADIQFAEANADFTVVCPHWGTEYRLTPDSMQDKWTSIFLEEGVDLVIGTHPHVIEPVKMITDSESGHEMLVYYSLGNFINWTGSSGAGIANRMVGGMADITITKDAQGKAFISEYDVDALVCHLTKETNGPTTYFLNEYSEELASQNAIRSQDSNFSYEYCINLCNEVWGDIWE